MSLVPNYIAQKNADTPTREYPHPNYDNKETNVLQNH